MLPVVGFVACAEVRRMLEVGDGREDESELMEEVGDNGRGGGGVKLKALRSGSKGELEGEA